MFKLTPQPQAIDLSVLRILLPGYMLLYRRIISENLVIGSAGEYFQPIGIFKLLSHPLTNECLMRIYFFWIALCILVLVGFLTRYIAPVWAAVSAFVLGYGSNFGSVSNASQLLVLASFVISLSYCSDIYSIDAWLFKKKTRDPWHYYWPKLTLQLLVVQSLFIVGLQKIYFQGFDWVFSDKLFLTIFANPARTEVGSWILQQPLWVSQVLAFYVLFIVELSAPLALFRPFNFVYPLLWTSLHIGISLTLSGFTTFFSHIPVYMCFYSFVWLGSRRFMSGLK